MSNLLKYAESEMRRAGLYDEDSDYDGMIPEAVMALMKVFSDGGHSGGSAPLAISIFNKLARFEPLTPLTGQDDEWMEVAEGVYQNVRCSHVFRDVKVFDGKPYDIDGRVFREPDGSCHTTSLSRVQIEFPYSPKTEYIDVSASEPPEESRKTDVPEGAPEEWAQSVEAAELEEKLLAARDVSMTEEEAEAQRQSFAYGNVNLSNPEVTRDVVEEAAREGTAEPQGWVDGAWQRLGSNTEPDQ